MTFGARIRGIFSTALTRLLLDNNFEIVRPSLTIKERFRLNENLKPQDIDIYDRRSRQGIHAEGTMSSIRALEALLRGHLTDVVLRKQSFPKDGIYRGKIKEDKTGNFVSVDAGSIVGKLARREVESIKADSIIVQVQKGPIYARNPFLSTRITIPGEYAVLIPEEVVKVSLKIRDIQTRLRLIEFGKKMSPEGWGIIWRTSAAGKSTKALENEIFQLAKTWEDISKRAQEENVPDLLWGRQYYMNVEFPSLSKANLDEARSKACSTIKGHHYYKACGRVVSSALEMAENMLEKGFPTENISEVFRETIKHHFPTEGSVINVEHVKPNGKVLSLGEAHIEKRCSNKLCYRRVFGSEGYYDDLDLPKEPGDFAVTEAEIGEWSYVTRYYSKEGAYKGAHINFHTPLELYPKWIRYVDLEVDVCALPTGKLRVVDECELEKIVTDGLISRELSNAVKDKVSQILEKFANTSVHEELSNWRAKNIS